MTSATPGPAARVLAAVPTCPPSPFVPVPIAWCYGVGDASEGPSPGYSAKPLMKETVHTPHLVLLPDTPLWYEGTFDAGEPTVLRIIGDDGVQVFAGGVRVPTLGCNLFPLGTGLGQTLTIRVVNNALHGGLLTVERAPREAYVAWERTRQLHDRLNMLMRKLNAAPGANPAATQTVLAALHDPTESNLEAAERQLHAWPLLLAPPCLGDPAPGCMTIRWETDTPGEAAVDWRIEGTASSPVAPWQFTQWVASGDGHFQATLTGLPLGGRISYRIRQGASTQPENSFRVPSQTGDFQFTVWGDSQAGWDILRKLLERMEADPPDFTVGVGDLVGTGCLREQWRDFFDTLAPFAATRPFILMPGNHDYDGYYDDFTPELFCRYARNRDQPNYLAWTWHNTRFVALDPNETFPISIREDGTQHQWLLRELASPAWLSADWRIILIHQPCFSQGKPDGYEGDLRIRDLLGPLSAEAGIDFIISGHTHDYERLKVVHPDGSCTHHVIMGGGGAPLTPAHQETPRVVMDQLIRVHHFGRFRISGIHAELEVIDINGHRRDHLVVTKSYSRQPSCP